MTQLTAKGKVLPMRSMTIIKVIYAQDGNGWMVRLIDKQVELSGSQKAGSWCGRLTKIGRAEATQPTFAWAYKLAAMFER